ncbi:MAG: DNA polymerase III subunit gamma/tau [Candidatus Taylorbacteria bacterium]|nr:DNA polymerase III subunit gamma/tau [Candidatus Taylorbacteria bacterium]
MNKDEKKPAENDAVLYRKHRPQAWADVVGQEHVVKVLEGSVKLGRISHAYLFSGGRGTGKTTLARIFAKAIGCSDTDIYEIDAASNRGIDDIRELRESVHTLPFESSYKVYIVDEVHMLTKEAFNALLKTLEEPPKHVIFMLATTEPDKLPDTVISRCQIFELKKPSRALLREYVGSVAKKEGFSMEAGAGDLVAGLGDNSFRDTLGVMQKIFSYSKDKKITLNEVELVTGAPKAELVRNFIDALALGGEAGKDSAFSALERALAEGIDMKIFAELAIEKARMIMMFKHAPTFARAGNFLKEYSAEDIEMAKRLAGVVQTPAVSMSVSIPVSMPKILLALLEAVPAISRSSIPSLPLELAVLRICGEGK